MGAEIPDGAVVVARAILNSSLWTMRIEDRVVALTCIAIANFRDAEWWDGNQKITIKRGQFVRSWQELAKACNLPLQVVRTSIKNLENNRDNQGVPFLTRKSTQRYTLYTMPKYDFYQDLRNYSDSVNTTSNLTRQNSPSNTTSGENQHEPNKASSAPKPGGKGHSTKRTVPVQPLHTSGKPEKLTTNNNNNNKNVLNKNKQQGPKPKTKLQRNEVSLHSTPQTAQDAPGSTQTPDPSVVTGSLSNVLNQVNYRRGVLLLSDLGVATKKARELAAHRPIGEIIDIVGSARGKANPPGWAVQAVTKGWGVPEDPAGRAEILPALQADAVALLATAPLRKKKGPYARRPGESIEQMSERIKRQKREAKSKK